MTNTKKTSTVVTIEAIEYAVPVRREALHYNESVNSKNLSAKGICKF